MGTITIKDIARMAGVSTAAVSMAINNRRGLSEERRKIILDIVDKTGYIPNQNARRLITESSNNIAVLLPQNFHSSLFSTELTDCILAFSRENSYNIVFTSYSEDGANVILPNILRARDVAGVLVFGDISEIALQEIKKQGLPFVLLDVGIDYDDCLTVRVDYRTAAYTAVSHLLELGHRDIAYIGNSKLQHFNMQTFEGFQQALHEKNVSIPINRIQFEAQGVPCLHKCVDNLLEGSCHPSAIFCTTDIYAIHSMRYLHSLGYRIPEDFSIIGIDNAFVSEFTSPPLTTIKVDREAMSLKSYALLLSAINGQEAQSVLLPSSELIIRGSTAVKD